MLVLLESGIHDMRETKEKWVFNLFTRGDKELDTYIYRSFNRVSCIVHVAVLR